MERNQKRSPVVPGFSFKPRYVPFVVLLLSLTVVFAGWLGAWGYVNKAAKQRFDDSSRMIESQITHRMAAYEQVLRGGQGLFGVSSTVDRTAWRNYVTKLKLEEHFPGIQGVGFSLHIPAAKLSQHINQIRSEGFTGYTVKPQSARDEYTSIIYLEPFDKRNRQAFGYDMFSEPVRNAAMTKARDTGVAALSGKVELVQEITDDKQAGFLLYLPVYTTLTAPTNVQERREALYGYVYSPFRATDLMRGILREQTSTVSFKVYDGIQQNTANLLYNGDTELGLDSSMRTPEFTATRTIDIAGRTWTISFNSTPVFERGLDFTLPTAFLVGGILLSILLFIISSMLATTRQRALELSDANEKLQLARADADKANRAKSAFLATMSHEIRTPMNGVIGMVDILAHSDMNEQQADAVKTIRESALTLLDLIDDVLDFSKIEAGRLELERTPVSITELVEGLCTTLVPIASKKGVDIALFVSPEVPNQVWSDPTRLRQVLYNLIGNAIKFSGDQHNQGHVSVRVEVCEDSSLRLNFCIADNGIGMSQETVAKLFNSFNQAETSTTRRFGGTGLGLAIASRLVQLMHGNIEVDSSLGEGSTFTVTLPMENVESDTECHFPNLNGVHCVVLDSPEFNADDVLIYLNRAGADVRRSTNTEALLQEVKQAATPLVVVVGISCRPELEKLTDSTQINSPNLRLVYVSKAALSKNRNEDSGAITLSSNILRRLDLLEAVEKAAGRSSPETRRQEVDTHSNPQQTSPPTVAEARKSGRLILVAEDDLINQKVILRQLSLLGYAAEVADDGSIALEMWRSGKYALLLSDLHMPVMDGYQLTQAIRAEEQAERRMPILALTANAVQGEARRARSVGMDSYLSKPVQLHLLKEELSKWMVENDITHTTQPTVESHTSKTLDISAITEVVGDNQEVLQDLLASYLEVVRQQATELNTAADADDTKKISMIAHKLKSSSRSVGALVLGDTCAELENACRTEDRTAIAKCLADFERELAAVEPEIHKLLKQERSLQNSD